MRVISSSHHDISPHLIQTDRQTDRPENENKQWEKSVNRFYGGEEEEEEEEEERTAEMRPHEYSKHKEGRAKIGGGKHDTQRQGLNWGKQNNQGKLVGG